MKKIILLLVLAVSLTNCKKEDNSPQKSSTTHDTVYVAPPPPPTVQHFQYYWDYKVAGDTHTYSDSGCLTVDEMNAKITTIGAFNVMKSSPCTP